MLRKIWHIVIFVPGQVTLLCLGNLADRVAPPLAFRQTDCAFLHVLDALDNLMTKRRLDLRSAWQWSNLCLAERNLIETSLVILFYFIFFLAVTMFNRKMNPCRNKFTKCIIIIIIIIIINIFFKSPLKTLSTHPTGVHASVCLSVCLCLIL